MSIEVPNTLLAQVKRKLNITWSDDETDDRVTEIINSAIPDMIHMLGIVDKNFDFSLPGPENDLFKNYCLYEWNHIPVNEFEDNYAYKIGRVKSQHAVTHYLSQQEGAADET